LKTAQRILIVNNHLLMGAGVEKLLSSSGQSQIIGSSFQSEADLVRDIWHYLPDIVIMSAQFHQITPTRLLSLLENYGSLRLIAVSEKDNSLEIYEKQRIKTESLADLTIAAHNN
ncbi:MAG: hypothetical protein GY803_07260, partial [Chloroflexi bacterium]|nr:hypothetical protein [Chloroflexota bacterium]